MTYALWTVQVLLALAYLFVGGMKLMLPAEELTVGTPVPALLTRFIGVCEVLAAFGLILPGLFKTQTWLTPLAAAGLVVIMIGAVAITVMTMGVMPAIFPLVLGLLAAFVAYGRWKVAPLGARTEEREPEPAAYGR